MAETTKREQYVFDAELAAALWLLLVVLLGLVWVSSCAFAPYGWWMDHLVLFSVLWVGVCGAFLTWAFGIIDLRAIR